MATAIQAIYRDLEYAKTLIKHRALINDTNDISGPGDEESWTFIGDETDPELARRIAEWEPMAQQGGGGSGGSVGGEKFGARSRALGKEGREADHVGA